MERQGERVWRVAWWLIAFLLAVLLLLLPVWLAPL